MIRLIKSYHRLIRAWENGTSSTVPAMHVRNFYGRWGLVMSDIRPGKVGDVDYGAMELWVPTSPGSLTGSAGSNAPFTQTSQAITQTGVTLGILLDDLAAWQDARVLVNWTP